MLETHPAIGQAKLEASKAAVSLYQVLEMNLERTLRRRSGLGHVAELTRDYHIYPDFHGNRSAEIAQNPCPPAHSLKMSTCSSPLSDSHMRGAIVGLTLDTSVEDLSLAYLACVQSLAYGIKHIHDEMKGCGTRT